VHNRHLDLILADQSINQSESQSFNRNRVVIVS